MSAIVIYHRNCWDGFCCAWLMSHVLPPSDTKYFAANYGESAPDVVGLDVYILDFSYPRRVLEEMASKARSILVLDHHKSSEKELAGLPFCQFGGDQSGARMTQTWLRITRNLHINSWLIDYTEDRDLWRHRLSDSVIVNAALRSYPLDFNVWNGLAERLPSEFVPEGKAIRRVETQMIAVHIGNARKQIICGHEVLTVNATVLFSEIAGELAKGRPFGACYFDRQDGMRQWSLRSDENGLDVSEIAKHFGGGGHKNAAGFEIPNPLTT